MAAGDLQARFAAIVKGTGIVPEKGMLDMVTPDLQRGLLPDLSTPRGQELVGACIPADAEVIFVDNLSAWVRTGREDAESWNAVQTWMLARRVEGKTVIFLHHSGDLPRFLGPVGT